MKDIQSSAARDHDMEYIPPFYDKMVELLMPLIQIAGNLKKNPPCKLNVYLLGSNKPIIGDIPLSLNFSSTCQSRVIKFNGNIFYVLNAINDSSLIRNIFTSLHEICHIMQIVCRNTERYKEQQAQLFSLMMYMIYFKHVDEHEQPLFNEEFLDIVESLVNIPEYISSNQNYKSQLLSRYKHINNCHESMFNYASEDTTSNDNITYLDLIIINAFVERCNVEYRLKGHTIDWVMNIVSSITYTDLKDLMIQIYVITSNIDSDIITSSPLIRTYEVDCVPRSGTTVLDEFNHDIASSYLRNWALSSLMSDIQLTLIYWSIKLNDKIKIVPINVNQLRDMLLDKYIEPLIDEVGFSENMYEDIHKSIKFENTLDSILEIDFDHDEYDIYMTKPCGIKMIDEMIRAIRIAVNSGEIRTPHHESMIRKYIIKSIKNINWSIYLR